MTWTPSPPTTGRTWRTSRPARATSTRAATRPGLKITDVRTYRVLMPWRGTKRWDGSAEGFSFAEFETDQGLVGVAEGLSSEADALRSLVLGKNPSIRKSED